MMSNWSQFCFTGGYIEVPVTLPGLGGVAGLWQSVARRLGGGKPWESRVWCYFGADGAFPDTVWRNPAKS